MRSTILRALMGTPRLFTPQAKSTDEPQGITVLAHGFPGTMAYYFENRLDALRRERPEFPVDMVNTATVELSTLSREAQNRLFHKRRVVIVRHVPPLWLAAIKAHHTSGVAYFLDDDLPGALFDPYLPLCYALRTTRRFLSIRAPLASLCDRVWVSTAALMERYPETGATVLPPLPLTGDDTPYPRAESAYNTVFYHGTASHTREIAFVAAVARVVQTQRTDTIFEIMGTRQALAAFRGIPRVRRLHPMPWSDYLAHTRAVTYEIGLAPLFSDGHDFNACRASTKIFDISRCGAVGLYSDCPPFNTAPFHPVLLPNQVKTWSDAICAALHAPHTAPIPPMTTFHNANPGELLAAQA